MRKIKPCATAVNFLFVITVIFCYLAANKSVQHISTLSVWTVITGRWNCVECQHCRGQDTLATTTDCHLHCQRGGQHASNLTSILKDSPINANCPDQITAILIGLYLGTMQRLPFSYSSISWSQLKNCSIQYKRNRLERKIKSVVYFSVKSVLECLFGSLLTFF